MNESTAHLKIVPARMAGVPGSHVMWVVLTVKILQRPIYFISVFPR